MPRKRARLTRKKKTTKKTMTQAPNGLSQPEFAALAHVYNSFIVEDREHEQLTFKLRDLALIEYQEVENGDPDDPDAYWIGEIVEIRANGTEDVWVKVQWFWSPQEVAEVIKSFDPTVCGKFEKLKSDNCDIISVRNVIAEHVEVKKFDETSIFQPFIENDDWFFRYEFAYDRIRVSPKPTRTACNICKIPYTPGEVKIHRFCPRPECTSFYHQSCLIKKGYSEANQRHRLLETWPDVDRTSTIRSISDRRLKRGESCRSRHGLPGEDPLSNIPPKLIAVADQPILRGNPGGGIVGNITSVTAARSLIYRALTGNGLIPDDWETRIGDVAAVPDMDTLPNCFCPSCQSAI